MICVFLVVVYIGWGRDREKGQPGTHARGRTSKYGCLGLGLKFKPKIILPSFFL
jgi:hypothetical protein